MSGIVFVALWIATLIVTGNDVSSSDSDSKILAYYAVFFIPFLIFLGWVLVVSALLIWRERMMVPSTVEP